MSFDQEQKNQQVAFFGSEKGGGMFGNKTYDFVLQEPYRLDNLYPLLKEEMLRYFAKSKIKWWRGADELPTNLTIATQIACLNHLYWLNGNSRAAEAFIAQLNPAWHSVPFANGRFIEFEYNGNPAETTGSFLGEKSVQRGVGSTCLNAAMLIVTNDGTKELLAIEWRYCEKYYQKAAVMDDDDPLYVSRKTRLNSLLNHEDCPLVLERGKTVGQWDYETAFQKFAVEPFYTTLAQTLLAWQLVAHQTEGISGYHYLQVIPDGNTLLLHGETSKEITAGYADIAQGWQSYLKQPERFRRWDPRQLLEAVTLSYDLPLAVYLEKRYWQ